ncbi:MAG: bifunctional glutamate N-acetyltransferase/amino-acid acetyltransferase ArgJ [Verrucomicrobia bacterium]|nr:bifunctional glutamate N-acetyltransferase/amino-acid acetyltransferase ArgJ [Verrucomicrobiota bacterium]
MKPKITPLPGSIVAPRGFLAAGVFCDIKRLGTGKGSDKGMKRDLALIVSEVPANAAGMFTTNQVCAAPVKLCRERVATGLAQAIVVNSGNANACTGNRGLKDARAMAALLANELHAPQEHILVASTGRIGLPLPMPNVQQGIRHAVTLLGNESSDAAAAAEAILTSDTKPKALAVEFQLGQRQVRIGGICKGAGMIQPGMSPSGQRPASLPRHATMLAFLTTDAAIEPRTLQLALQDAVAQSFNRITVDGDMSTNDTVLILANGLAENPCLTLAPGARSRRKPTSLARPTPPDSRDFATFQTALNHLCLELAKMIVRDGEGVHRVVTLRLSGAKTQTEADTAVRAVANSPLVKTSWHGGDPNWGRIMDALGYSPATIVEDQIDIGYSAPGKSRILWSVRRGQPTKASFAALCRAVAPTEFDLHIRLNLGPAGATLYAADLTEAYVEFNKGDVSNPASLGG